MESKRIDPWEHLADEFSDSARRLREERNRLGRRFRELQQESYIAWSEWDEAMGNEEVQLETIQGEISGTVIHEHVDELRKRRNRAPQKTIEKGERNSFDLTLAASSHQNANAHEDKILEEELVEVGTFDINGIEYTALANGEGLIFIYPCPDALSLRIGEDTYTLKYVEIDTRKYCLAVELDQGELEYFLGLRRRGNVLGQIIFE